MKRKTLNQYDFVMVNGEIFSVEKIYRTDGEERMEIRRANQGMFSRWLLAELAGEAANYDHPQKVAD